MTPLLPPLLVLSAHPSITEVLRFQLSGLLVVFMALGSIWLLVATTGWFFQRRAPARPLPTAASPLAAGSDGALIAVITAAVQTTLGPGTRVVLVKPIRVDGDWAREGRRQIFSSHRTR
jgi:hypothetical protein